MPTFTHTVRVVAICGSLRAESHTRAALLAVLQGAQELSADTQFIDLDDYHLPLFNASWSDANLPEGVLRLRRDVRQASGIILGTPEYHAGYSGVLKNALDFMGFTEFEGKMIGLLAVSGGRMGAANALSGLRTIGRSLHAWVVPYEVSIPQAWRQFDSQGAIKDPELAERVKELGRQVARFAYLHSAEQAMAFLRAWEEAPVNPGGE
jgi:NAD(P)H-dependent FMN reductase